MTEHPQVEISFGDRAAQVDEGIAPLILELWKAGIDTVMSCENNNGRVWIQFPSSDDAEQFVSIVAEDYDEDIYSIYNRAVGGWEDDDWETFRNEHAWRYDCSAEDYNAALYDENGELETPAGSNRYIVIWVSIRFPLYDYEEILRRVAERNSRDAGQANPG